MSAAAWVVAAIASSASLQSVIKGSMARRAALVRVESRSRSRRSR